MIKHFTLFSQHRQSTKSLKNQQWTPSSSTATKLFGEAVRSNNNDDDNSEQLQQQIPEPGAEARAQSEAAAAAAQAEPKANREPSSNMDDQELIKAFKALKAEQEKTNAERMEAMEASFDKMTRDLNEMWADLTREKNEMWADLQKLKAELTDVKTGLGQLKGRLDNFVGAFEPEIQFAAFETFIFYFVEMECSKLNVQKNLVGQFQLAMTTLCNDVMILLVLGKGEELEANVPKSLMKPLVLRALQGLEEYVAYEDAITIKENMYMGAAKRNELSNTGKLLESFNSSPDFKATKKYEDTKEKVEKCMQHINKQIIDAAKSNNPYEDVKKAVKAVVDALKNKNSSDIDISDVNMKVVVNQLENIIT